MALKIDKRLNIVLEVPRENRPSIFIHSVPIGTNVYEANYRLITKTAVAMYGDGLAPGACSRICALALRSTAQEMDAGGGDTYRSGAESLLQEIWRLTNVLMPGPRGWETVPFHEVIHNNTLEEEQIKEVQNILSFFTVASWFHRESERKDIYEILKKFGAQIVSSNVTEFSSSLPTSTAPGTTGVTGAPMAAAPSLVPH